MIRMVVPHKATGPGDVTILRAPGRRLTKLVTESGVIGYEGAAAFEREAWRIDCVEDLAELLADLAARSDSCAIRAVPKPKFADRPKVLRRSRDRPGVEARFVEVPRIWAMIDVEHLPNPGIDPTDPVLVGGAVRMHLPPPFRGARCVSQLSSQAGLKDGLRCHLWFVFDRPLVRAELVRWLKGVAGVDLQVFVPVQPHYTAAPIFSDPDLDPCTDGRLAVLPGFSEVAVPDLPDPERLRAAFSPAEHRPYVPPRRGLSFKATRSEKFMLKCVRGVAEAPVGARHLTIVRVAACLYGLAKGGSLDPHDVEARILGAAAINGLGHEDPEEVTAALRWAWEHAEPWRLP